MAAALVVGNMIGSGTYLLPSSLAPFGAASLLGWAASLGGALLLAFTFAWLSRQLPVTGGPYAYARAAFGDFAGFITAWCYWVSIWCGNAAIAIAFAGYLGSVVPAIAASPFHGAAAAIAAVWLCTLFNVLGVRTAGWVQLVTSVLKLLPLLAIAVAGAWLLTPADFTPFNPSARPAIDITTATVALTLWAFLGMESATVPADQVRDADRTVPLATVLGTLVAALATILACTAVLGFVPAEVLVASGAPFADAAHALWGPLAGLAFAIAAAIACFGALNGWILMQGQVPFAAARDGLFPRRFASENRNGTPAYALVPGSVITTILVIANFEGSLVALFTWSILLSTAAVLVPYVVAMAAAVLGRGFVREPSSLVRVVAALALAYSLYALFSTGTEALAWGAGLFLAGLLVHVLLHSVRKSEADARS